jgi:ribosomal protein S21
MKVPTVTRYNNDWKSREAYERQKHEDKNKIPTKHRRKEKV